LDIFEFSSKIFNSLCKKLVIIDINQQFSVDMHVQGKGKYKPNGIRTSAINAISANTPILYRGGLLLSILRKDKIQCKLNY